MNSIVLAIRASLVAVAAAALSAGPVLAQGPTGAASAAGTGPGGKGAASAPRSGNGVTPGWKIMTPAERTEYQAAMGRMRTQGECGAYLDSHYKEMMSRSLERGLPAPSNPHREVCNVLPK